IPADVLPEGASASSPVLFSGDTLFQGGPGATGRSYSGFDTIIQSITETRFEVPGRTVVPAGRRGPTTIGPEAPSPQAWPGPGSHRAQAVGPGAICVTDRSLGSGA